MAFFWVCNNSSTRQSRAGIIRMTQHFTGIAFRKWHLRWEILIRKNMFGHHATQRNTHCSFMSGWMNERRFLILLKNRRLTEFHIIRSFLLHELCVHYQRCLKSQKIKKKIKDNGSNLPLWLFVGVDEVCVHTSKQVEANSKLWSHVKWESSFFLLCLLKRRNTRVFGDHLGIIFLNVFEKSSNICFHAPHNRADLAHRPCAG